VQRLRSCGDASGVVAVSWMGSWDGRRNAGGFGSYDVELVQESDANFGESVSITHTHQGSSSSMQIIEISPRDLMQPYAVIVTPCWLTSTTKRCFPEFSSASGAQRAVRSSTSSTWVVRLRPAAESRSLQSFHFTSLCTSLQFQASFTLVNVPSPQVSYPHSKASELFSRHISNIMTAFSDASLTTQLVMSCMKFSDIGYACGTSISIPYEWRGNASAIFARNAAPLDTVFVLPHDDNSVVFVGVVCGNESAVNVTAVIVPLPFSMSLLILQLNSLSAIIQIPFALPLNVSSGKVLFATSTSLSGELIVDFMAGSLHCSESSATSAAASYVATGTKPAVNQLQVDDAIFAFVPSLPQTHIDICWSQPTLLDLVSGQTLAVDGSWSLFDYADDLSAMGVIMQKPGAPPMELQRDTSISMVALIGSTIMLSASCSFPACAVTWVISKRFDLDITNSSSGQNGRFNPRPHHGGGIFRVNSMQFMFWVLFAFKSWSRCVFGLLLCKFLGSHCSWVYTVSL
jgi:hypothetical protein